MTWPFPAHAKLFRWRPCPRGERAGIVLRRADGPDVVAVDGPTFASIA